jgi:lysophospholipase L1-like esterase
MALVLLAASPGRASHVALRCTAPAEITGFRVPLPNTARAIRQGRSLTIVAIGSSSTAGVGASDATHAYPAMLAEELRRRWPRLEVTVINKGVSGETSSEARARFERDVLPYRPQLVIWQTGSIQTLRDGGAEEYAAAVREGIGRLKAAKMDVVLMDPQFAPRVLARPLHLRVVDAVGALGNDTKVAVFQRFALMRHWVSSGQYQMDDIVSRDGLHLNDVSYGCIARLLAGSLADAAQATQAADEAPAPADTAREPDPPR